MQAIFTLASLPLPHICRTTLTGTWSQSTKPHQSESRVTSTIQPYSRGEKISQNTGTNLAAGNNYQWFPTSTTTVSVCNGTSTIKKTQMAQWNCYRWGERRNEKQSVIVFLLEQQSPKPKKSQICFARSPNAVLLSYIRHISITVLWINHPRSTLTP